MKKNIFFLIAVVLASPLVLTIQGAQHAKPTLEQTYGEPSERVDSDLKDTPENSALSLSASTSQVSHQEAATLSPRISRKTHLLGHYCLIALEKKNYPLLEKLLCEIQPVINGRHFEGGNTLLMMVLLRMTLQPEKIDYHAIALLRGRGADPLIVNDKGENAYSLTVQRGAWSRSLLETILTNPPELYLT
jgi:hypothetical protein